MSLGIYHYKTLQKLSDDIFKKPIKNSSITDIIVINKYPYYLISQGINKYLLLKYNKNKEDVINDFPIVINDSTDCVDGRKFYKVIRDYSSLNVVGKQTMSFKELVDSIAPFEHSNPNHFTLYKLICIAGLCSRINVSISTEASFGKDSLLDIIGYLTPTTSKTTPTSMASIIYRLNNRILALNEISDLKGEDMSILELFLATAGAFNNTFENPKRGSTSYGTNDVYNISNLSLMLLYNNYEYFLAKNKDSKFFDYFFKDHIRDRFLSIRFEGRLTEDFTKNKSELSDVEIREQYLTIIRNIQYYLTNSLKNDVDISKHLKGLSQRQKTSYYNIAKYVWEYCEEDEVKYEIYLGILDNCIRGYTNALKLDKSRVSFDSQSRVVSYKNEEINDMFNL